MLYSFNQSYAESVMPQWIKNNAKWWSQGAISDSEYLKGIEYLVSQGIIKVPIKEVTATNTGLSDGSMAKSLVVHFKGSRGDFDVYTISLIIQTSQSTEFQFESIPSKDKKQYYDLISYYVNNGGTKDPTNVNIDILAGDGSTIETFQYGNCQVSAYYMYVNDNKQQYRLSGNEVAELRDNADFVCQGVHIIMTQTPHV